MWSLEGSNEDRRKFKRYPIERDVVIRIAASNGARQTGVGKTVNISSQGMLVATDLALDEGSSVELAVDWPVALNGDCPLSFLVSGSVVRWRKSVAAIRISKYQFRTRGSGRIQGFARTGGSA
jgi:hypothetical protein